LTTAGLGQPSQGHANEGGELPNPMIDRLTNYVLLSRNVAGRLLAQLHHRKPGGVRQQVANQSAAPKGRKGDRFNHASAIGVG
jgi:hypothetical protein